MSGLPGGTFKFVGPSHTFLLAKGATFRTLLESGDWVPPSAAEKNEARAALQALGEANFGVLNTFAVGEGVIAPGVASRRSPRSQAATVIVALDDAHFGTLRSVESGERHLRGNRADNAPVTALLSTIRARRGGLIAFVGDEYRVADVKEAGRWRARGYSWCPRRGRQFAVGDGRRRARRGPT